MEMNTGILVDLDRLPIKRLDAIDEAGNEHFPPELGYEEKRLQMIRRVDFSCVLDREDDDVFSASGDISGFNANDKDGTKKKKKKRGKKEEETESAGRAWQGLIENLQMAQQELSIIIDVIGTVEANDAVTVAGMQKPKQPALEQLSDLAISAATKLQRLRHLGRYFKQSSKALEKQVSREARFYGSLIRLQQNWKVKRQRLAVSGPGNDGFMIDLLDATSVDPAVSYRPSSLSTVRVEHDSAGILGIQLPAKSCRFLRLRFPGSHPNLRPSSLNKSKLAGSHERTRELDQETLTDDDVNSCIRYAHSMLRGIHQSIFEEQVFDMVNRETFNQSEGVNVTGMREDFLQLSIGQETSVCLHLVPAGKEDSSDTINSKDRSQVGQISNSDSLAPIPVETKYELRRGALVLPSPISLEIYLQSIFHEKNVIRAKDRHTPSTHTHASIQHNDGHGLLGHFCMTISHRIFSNNVILELERLAKRIPYLHLLSHPSWYSRTSSWSVILKVPQSILRGGWCSDAHDPKSGTSLQFRTKVVVNDDQIAISGEGAPSIIGSFKGSSADTRTVNSYSCDLQDLPLILLQQVASQVICWLHEEALQVGIKVNKDFQCLYFELDQGELLGLLAHVDPEDDQGCISWWVVMDDGSADEGKISASTPESENRRFLGYLTLEDLYTTLMDLVTLCGTGGSH